MGRPDSGFPRPRVLLGGLALLSARQRFPGRGTSAARAVARVSEGPMLTVPPPEDPKAPPSRLAGGQFAPGAKPIQDLIGTGVRELFTSLLDAGTAVRLGDTSSRPRYFGTVLPTPQTWRSPADVNSPDSVDSAVINSGNAPQMVNKNASEGPPRIAASLPARSR
jgi:hypothetical protein